MKKVLIVPVGADNPGAQACSPSALAALCLEAAARAAGQPADVFLYFNEYWPTAYPRLLAQIAECRYDVIGVSFMTYNRFEAYELLREIPKIVPDCRIIVGGVHATFLYEQLLGHFPQISAVAISEGEEAFAAFCRAPDRLDAAPGIAWRDDSGAVRVNPPAPASRDLDALPLVDYTLLRGHGGNALVQTTRGCVARCRFCSLRILEPNLRTKSPRRIVAEWEQIREVLGPTRPISIMDALYNVSLDHVKGMCQALIDAGLTSNPWDAELRARPVDREMLAMMKRCGCFRIAIGIESGNEEIRRHVGKAIGNEDVRRVFALARELKIPTIPFLITGLPGETDETVDETIRLYREIQPYYYVGTVPPQAYPGSEFYSTMKERGLISDEYWLYRHSKNWGDLEIPGNMPIYSVERNPVEIMRWCLATDQAVTMGRKSAPYDRIIRDDEEFDRHDPWREDEAAGRLRELLGRKALGSLKARLRRRLRPIRSSFHATPDRLYPGQALAISLQVFVNRPADIYVLVQHRTDHRLCSVIWEKDRAVLCDAVASLARGVAAHRLHYWTLLAPVDGLGGRGPCDLHLIVCGEGESVLDRKNWLDWRRQKVELCLLRPE
jgi:radical SAM superfamily enzyme YgiQ (UPF0313 family)